ncbi:MAG: hypothetical protein NDI82_03630 [Anaeromyxobacteraceae bacterium]|nr:hypothetical protein [Anaeromyxobacteraceae bacterium]
MLDGALRILHEGSLPVAAGRIAVHPRDGLLAVASESGLVLTDLEGTVRWRRVHRPWAAYEGGAAAFVGDGAQLVAIFPEAEGVKAVLLDVASGDVVAEKAFEVAEPAGFFLVPHPSQGLWALWAGAGQDGQWTYWLRLNGEGIAIEEVEALSGRDHGPMEFNASGAEALLEVEGGLERYALPESRLLGRFEAPVDEEFALSSSPLMLDHGRALVANEATARLHILELESMTLGEEVLLGVDGPPWYMLPVPRASVLSIHGDPRKPQTIALLAGAPLFG